ncbi:MAG: sulfurtransferase TusA family protein [Armatimonadetes bacterium]|nr:sulfurtransferase TusA family protein [Armatimonadota bacterium]
MAAEGFRWKCDETYDGGDRACGELIHDLSAFFRHLPSGTRVCVTAFDPAAFIDIPAWCHLTRHRFLEEDPPYFLIERR